MTARPHPYLAANEARRMAERGLQHVPVAQDRSGLSEIASALRQGSSFRAVVVTVLLVAAVYGAIVVLP